LGAVNFFEFWQRDFMLTANFVSNARSNPAPGISTRLEREIVLLLCALAAIHVFVFSAAFPFFITTDEQFHLDLAVKYSRGDIPRSLNAPCAEVLPFLCICGTMEFLSSPEIYPNGRMNPPLWTLPTNAIVPAYLAMEAMWNKATNLEASQPPVYYTLAGAWWRMGKALGFQGIHLLYWLRFLNVFAVAGLVWLAYLAARMFCPENLFVRLGVPALIVFMPQTAFYSIENDVLSPLGFGAAFILLVRWLQTDLPGARLGALTGLVLAATFLTKTSNVPLLAVSALAVLLKAGRLFKAKKLRAAKPALLLLAACAGLPMAAWLAWCKIIFGDFTGSAAKIKFLSWTYKPFAEWWHHPIFTLHGFWVFLSENLATLWQGEILWHRKPLAFPAMDLFYAILSVGLVALALVALFRRPAVTTTLQWQVLWFAFGCVAVALAFFGYLSIIYDFHDCFYPSRAHPYFTSGRLLLGALIPFLLLFVFGLDRALSSFGNSTKFLVLVVIMLFMLGSEIAIDWPIFPNVYNWYHV
jgi:hypothetical protein